MPDLRLLSGGRQCSEPPPPQDGDPGPGGGGGGGADESWRSRLLTTEKGNVKATIGNILWTLRQHPALKEKLGYDSRLLQPCWRDPPPWGAVPGPVSDADAAELSLWIQADMGVSYAQSTCADAIMAASHGAPFDRVYDYLTDLRWDGGERLSTWLSDYIGVDDTHYTRSIGRAWAISAVARALEPGCKADCILILEGPQGAGKSSALRALAGDEFFAELSIDVGDKDSILAIHGPWIVEWSELAGFGRREAEAVKGFLSRQVDRVRPPYGRFTMDCPRRVIFAGSTNESRYLGDPTGGRRYWPARVGRIRIANLQQLRDQIWAEAVAAYRGGEQWWLDGTAEIVAIEEQGLRLDVDPWEDIIAEYLARPGTIVRSYVRSVDLLRAIGIQESAVNLTHSRRVNRIVERLGWRRDVEKIDGRDVHVFRAPGSQAEIW